MSLNLYSLSAEYLELLNEDELTEYMEARIDAIQDDFSKKAIAIGGLIRELNINQDVVKNEIKRLREKSDKIYLNTRRLEEYLMSSMESLGYSKIESSLYNVKIKMNPCSVNIIEEYQIPNKYIIEKIERRINNELIKKDIKNNIDVPGAELIQRKRIEIK